MPQAAVLTHKANFNRFGMMHPPYIFLKDLTPFI